HLGCDTQTTPPKEEAFKRLALASEGRCVLAGCAHRARYSIGNVYRTFQARTDWITPTAFARALLAIELGDSEPTDTLAAQTSTEVGHSPRRPPSRF
ncbi:DUF6420 family protein, partial [Streptomyces albidoflavus]